MCCLYVWAALVSPGAVRLISSKDKGVISICKSIRLKKLWSAYFTHFALVFLKYESEV